jgi:predicted Zn finger-like uncharacterized protein
MKIACEKCAATYDIEDSRIPPSGFIMKCPGCMHSFKVTKSAAAPAPAAPAPSSSGPTVRYHIRRRTGKTFGPLVASAVVVMLQNGKLEGDEQVSLDGTTWEPLTAVEAFAPYAKQGTGRSAGDLPAPKGGLNIDNLPAPKGGIAIEDLPAPKGPVPSLRPDPLAPKRAAQPAAKPAPAPPAIASPPVTTGDVSDLSDLPTPKRASPSKGMPLPMPKAAGIPNLPMPKGGLNIPDLPAPKKGLEIPNLPAPKAPSPAKGASPAPAGANLPGLKQGGQLQIKDLPAPKGPAAAPPQMPPPRPGLVDLPAPKRPSGVELPTAPPGATARGLGPPPRGPALSPGLDDFDLAPSGGTNALDLGEVDLLPSGVLNSAPLPPPTSFAPPAELAQFDLPPPPPPPALPPEEVSIISSPHGEEQGLPTFDATPASMPNQLHVDLDAVDSQPPEELSLPAMPDRSSFEPSSEAAELVGAAHSPPNPSYAQRAKHGTATRQPEAAPMRERSTTKKRKVVMVAGGLGGAVLVLGAIGIISLTSDPVGKIDATALAKLRGEIADDTYGSYLRVADRLKKNVQKSPRSAGARAMAAEVLSLAVFTHGGEAKLARSAQEMLTGIDPAAETNPEIIKARAANAIASGKPQDGEARLVQPLVAGKLATDALAALILGWAQLRSNRIKSAEATFTKVLKLDPKLAAAAYGLALCRERGGDPSGAATWYANTLALSPNHFAAALATSEDKPADAIQGLIQVSGNQASPSELAQAWILVGQKTLAQAKLDEAEAAFKKAAEADPGATGAAIGLGMTMAELGRLTEAKEKLEAAHGADPGNPDATVALARVDLALGQPFVAQDLLTEAAKGAPKDARIKVLQGRAEESLDKEGAQERATALYKQATELDPKLVEGYAALATQALKQGRADQAQAIANDGAKAAGDTPDAHNLVGQVLLARLEAAKAQLEFQAALEKLPGHLPARMNLAAALEAQRRPDAALAELERVRARVPSYPGLSQRLGALYQALGRIDDALKAYDAALKLPGATLALRYAAASFYFSIGKCERAKEISEQITNADPRNADVIELLAKSWECAGKMDVAVLNIKHAIDVSDKPQYHLTYAKMLEKLDQGQEALAQYEMAARGRLPDAFVGRARLNLNYGANRDALHDLDLALKLDKNRPDALTLRGRAFLALQQFKQAEGSLDAASKITPKDAEVHYWLAEACTGANDFRCAGSHYREATRLGLSGEHRGDAFYKLGVFERSHGSQGAAREAFQQCMEFGTAVEKTNCGKEMSTLGGFK